MKSDCSVSYAYSLIWSSDIILEVAYDAIVFKDSIETP